MRIAEVRIMHYGKMTVAGEDALRLWQFDDCK
jgi:hypothetical protein